MEERESPYSLSSFAKHVQSSVEISDDEKTSAKKFGRALFASHSAFAPGTTTEDATPSFDNKTKPVPLETLWIDSECFKLTEYSSENVLNNHFPSSSSPNLPTK